MNRKRFYRNRYRSHPFPTLLTTATATIVAAVIALAVMSPTVYSRVYPPPYKLSSCATVVPRQTAAVSQHFRSTNPHIIAATDSEYSRSKTTVHHRRPRYAARLIGETVTVGQPANNTSNHTRCYKIKFTTAVPTTKRWSPILKTYPNFPVMNTTVTKVTTAKITKVTKITKASTTTEATTSEPSEEIQETEETTTTEETSSKEETTCTEEIASTEETSSTEATTCLEEETTLTEVTTPKKATKKITTESTITEKASKTTVMSTEKTGKTTGKSSKTTGKLSKATKKMTTKPTEAPDEVVTCSEDPSCDEEPSCVDDEVTTSKPTKTKPPPQAKKTTRGIKPKNRSKMRSLDHRRIQPPSTMHRQSSSPSLSSATIAVDDSLRSDDGLNYESP